MEETRGEGDGSHPWKKRYGQRAGHMPIIRECPHTLPLFGEKDTPPDQGIEKQR